jgi:hypothetical protein
LEPFFGLRYITLNDYTQNDIYSRFETLTGNLVYTSAAGGIFIPPPALALVGTEQIDSVTTRFENHMFGAQLGLRWFKQKSRWNLSGEVRAFAVQNFQRFETRTNTERTVYASGVAPTTVTGVLYQSTVGNAASDEFVFGTEIRTQAAYDITKYIQLRTGVQFMNFGRGIARGNNPLNNDEDLLTVGYTIGVAVNR